MPLVLDVLRHGEAGPAGSGGDAERALSPGGIRAIAELAERLAAEGWRPDRIFSSPLLRARQTGEIVRGAAPGAPAIELLDELLAESDPEDALEALDAHGAGAGHVLLVTHQPLAGRLAARLTGQEASFHAGTLVRIQAGPEPAGGQVIRAILPGAGS